MEGEMSMKFIFAGKNLDIKPAVKDYVEKRFSKIGKFFNSEPEADVTISKEKKMQIFEVTIKYRGMFFRAEEKFEDIFTAIDKAVDVIERQIRKNRTRLEKRLYGGASKFNIDEYDSDIDEVNDYKIIRRKYVGSKPMDPEEAILQMNLLGHDFFMFTNTETYKTNVVYKRKDGNYGLLEPES